MSERKPSVLVRDILKCIEHVQVYTGNISFEEFCSDYMITEAFLYNIQVMGEAAAKLPDDIKNAEPHIPWQVNQRHEEPAGT